MKTHFSHFVGIDVGSKTLACSIFIDPKKPIITQDPFDNDLNGFDQLLKWFKQHSVTSQNAVVCLEACGVYAEHLTHFFHAKGFQVAVEPPLKVKRAFNPSSEKTDPVDSQQIAQYAFRFFDQLRFFQPKEETLENIKTLLATRELFVSQLTANQNSRKALDRKYYPNHKAKAFVDQTIQYLKDQIKEIEKQIKQNIDQDPHFKDLLSLLTSVPGVGLLLASNLLVLTEGFQASLTYKNIASYAGIVPKRFESGTSVKKRPKCPKYGPSKLRKLLYLAALSLRTHQPQFKKYFLRKVEEGKSKRLVINNIANKLLKIIYAVIKSKTQYIKNFRSVNPLMIN